MVAPERPALGLPDRLDGIDVSSCQGENIDYAKVAAAGFRFAIVKASEGIAGTDPDAARHRAGFHAAGMITLPYHFLHPSQGAPALQVRNLVRALGDTWPGRVCLDFETRQAPESNSELVRFLEEAVGECMQWGVLAPVVYGYPAFFASLQPELGRSEILGCCPLWMAYIPGSEPYTPSPGEVPHVPIPWQAAAAWQYGGNNGWRVPGIQTPCDRDLFMGDAAAFRAFLGLPAPATSAA